MELIRKDVLLSEIRSEDETFRLSCGSLENRELIDSICEFGLLHPILLRKTTNGYQILSGFKRNHAFVVLKKPAILATIFPFETTDIVCIKAILQDISLPISIFATSKILTLLENASSSSEEFLSLTKKLLKISSPHIIQEYKIFSALSSELQFFVKEGGLSLSILPLFIQKVEPAFQIQLATLFHELKLSFQKQREIITYLYELSIIEETSMQSIFELDEIKPILEDSTLDRGLKASQLRTFLKKKRYPTISHMEENFKQQLKQLGFPSDIQLSPPENFEGDTFRVQFISKNLKEFQTTAKTLQKISQNPKLAQLFRKF